MNIINIKKKPIASLLLLYISLCSVSFASDIPFSSCPSTSFLIQGSSEPKLYGVDISSGDYQILNHFQSHSNSLNSLAFNRFDNYLYAWSNTYNKLVKITGDYEIIPLSVSNGVASSYIGDISPNVNKYYYYNPTVGLSSIGLDPTQPDYLVNTLLNTTQSQKIYDFAINPSSTNNYAYSVNNNGVLIRINLNPTTMTENIVVNIANLGISGVYGAAYFDNNNNLYISHNLTGKIYKINVMDSNPQAVVFAKGPKSSSNDGARCAIASIIDASAPATMDFGDAPDSYGTTIDNNGARHVVDSNGLYLGDFVDAEKIAYQYPLSDDTHNENDEDGVIFLTSSNIGQQGLLQVKSSGNGLLNAWIDWNQNGVFDANEQLLNDKPVTTGQNIISYNVPSNATVGSTWARFRLSLEGGIGPTGGVANGEVEDYNIMVNNGTTTTYYPGSSIWTTVAFEDEWPLQSDYDMNDVSFQYRSAITEQEGVVKQLVLTGKLSTVGGDYQNGFAIRLPNVPRETVDDANILFTINGKKKVGSLALEEGTVDAVFIATSNIRNYISNVEGCHYFRTEDACDAPVDDVFEFTMVIPFKEGQEPSTSTFPAAPFDPFIFATPNTWRRTLTGGIFMPGRSLEIHLKNHAPTVKFDRSQWGTGDDRSDVSLGHYFQNENGLPWAMEVPGDWEHPLERKGLLDAYPNFKEYIESNGALQRDWFISSKANSIHTYKSNN